MIIIFISPSNANTIYNLIKIPNLNIYETNTDNGGFSQQHFHKKNKVVQVKSKFGQLRFYIEGDGDEYLRGAKLRGVNHRFKQEVTPRVAKERCT